MYLNFYYSKDNNGDDIGDIGIDQEYDPQDELTLPDDKKECFYDNEGNIEMMPQNLTLELTVSEHLLKITQIQCNFIDYS